MSFLRLNECEGHVLSNQISRVNWLMSAGPECGVRADRWRARLC